MFSKYILLYNTYCLRYIWYENLHLKLFIVGIYLIKILYLILCLLYVFIKQEIDQNGFSQCGK